MDGTPAVEPKAPADLKGLEDTKYFHIMGCSLMSSLAFGKEIVKAMNMFAEQGTKISFDPNIRMEMLHDPTAMDLVQEVFRNSSIFMPGVSELKQFTGKDNIEDAVKAAFENEKRNLLVLKRFQGIPDLQPRGSGGNHGCIQGRAGGCHRRGRQLRRSVYLRAGTGQKPEGSGSDGSSRQAL